MNFDTREGMKKGQEFSSMSIDVLHTHGRPKPMVARTRMKSFVLQAM
jgi:hypothetical protein